MMVRNDFRYAQFKRKNRNVYCNFIIGYAERWAERMEVEMQKGTALRECAEVARKSAELIDKRDAGLTPRMKNAAKKVLYKWWVYGDNLEVMLEGNI